MCSTDFCAERSCTSPSVCPLTRLFPQKAKQRQSLHAIFATPPIIATDMRPFSGKYPSFIEIISMHAFQPPNTIHLGSESIHHESQDRSFPLLMSKPKIQSNTAHIKNFFRTRTYSQGRSPLSIEVKTLKKILKISHLSRPFQ